MRKVIVEANPTYASLCEQLRGLSDEPTLLLIQPDTGLGNPDLLLVLLRRLADRDGLTLGLVSDDPALRRQATALGLAAFRDMAAAERAGASWQPPRREQVGFGPDGWGPDDGPPRPPVVDQP